MMHRYVDAVIRLATRRPWRAATADGGAPPAPPPVGAVRPRRPGPMAWDWLAGVIGAGCRRVGYRRERTDGGPRPPRRPATDLDVKTVAGGSG